MAWEPEQRESKPKVEPIIVLLFAIAVALAIYAFREGRLGPEQLIFFAVLIPSIVFHEVSHGYVANLFGDTTAKNAGRLTLNPFVHMDLWGTFLIPAGLLLLAGLPFGYAKPVPVNTARMSRNQALWTSLAGPLVNIAIALAVAVLLNTVLSGAGGWTYITIGLLGVANIVLATVNLIPIPPLDGSAIIERFLPSKWWPQYLTFRRYSMALLLVLFLLAYSLIGSLVNVTIGWWETLL